MDKKKSTTTREEVKELKRLLDQKNRELEIEVALERVRAKAMAMKNSEEIAGLVATLFKELVGLDFALTRCYIYIIDPESLSFRAWTSNTEMGDLPESYFIKYLDLPYFKAMIKAWKTRKPKFVYELGGEEKKEVDRVLFEETEYSRLPESVKSGMASVDRVYLSFSFNSFGGLQTGGLEPLSENQMDILYRFSKVFDMTYTRFNDLKQVEAQAREAQIEASLERVRARTMAMQHSNELMQVVEVLYTQFELLGMTDEMTDIEICMIDEETRIISVWQTHRSLTGDQVNLQLPVTTSPQLKKEFNIWKKTSPKERSNLYFQHMMARDELRTFLGELKKLKGWERVFESFKQNKIKQWVTCNAYFQYGMLTYQNVQKKEGDINGLLPRFAKVFEQTYTRFLDLQKAEAQAREAQIEAALERVRTRSMAMHKSEELIETATLLYKELSDLGIPPYSSGFVLIDEKKAQQEVWFSAPGGAGYLERFFLPLTGDPILDERYRNWKKKIPVFYEKVEGTKLIEHLKFVSTFFGTSEAEEHAQQFPDTIVFYCGYFPEGYLHILTEVILNQDQESIMKRFTQVFAMTYRRFLDLKNAEAQAREAEIELALERVRARTMAMQKSDELKDLVKVIFDQLGHLRINAEHAGIVVDYEPKKDWHFWIAETQDIPAKVTVPYLDLVWDRQFTKAKKEGKDFFTTLMDFDEKNSFYKELLPHIEKLTKKARDFYFSCPGLAISTAIQKDIGLYIENFSGSPYSGEENEILIRFAKVFQQAYTRFLDLQKAEAQTQEAQIEAALEKVRSRSLAMHTTNELGEVVVTIVEKLKDLGVVLDANGVVLCTYFEDSKDVLHWISSPDFTFSGSYLLPYFDHVIFNDAWQSRENGDTYFSKGYSVEEKNSFWEYAFENSDYRHFPDDFKQWVFQNDKHILSFAWQKKSAILIPSHTGVVPSEEDVAILKRFAKVFEQSYVRFLDLKNAEAQAREAQIESALERVRSRSMAMQKSHELADLSMELVMQVQALGIDTWFCAFNINDEDGKGSMEWGSNGQGTFPKYRTPREGVFLRYYEAGQRGETLFINEIDEKECPGHYEYLCTLPGVGEQLLKMKKEGIPFPTSQIDHIAFFKYGYILFITFEPAPEAHDIFIRFAKVFEQTYTRFLDLQRSEAQAREAQIEAALERVRSRAMAMHDSTEMLEVSDVLFQQIRSLGGEMWGCGVVICQQGADDDEVWFANEKGVLPPIAVPHTEDSTHKKMYEGWVKKLELYSESKEGIELKEHYNYMLSVPTVKPLFEDILESGLTFPDWQKWHAAYFSCGYLLFITLHEYNDERIFVRFAKVFEQAYTRFQDLKKAEAQAREAQIELSLERIRAQVTAMSESSELLDIVVTMRTEFVALGHEAHYFWYMRWLPEIYEKAMTSGDGTRIGMVMSLPRHIHGDIKLLADWEKSDEPTVVFPMDVETALEYVHKMITLGDFKQLDPNAPTEDDIRHIGGLTFIMARTTHGEIGYSLPGVVPGPPAEDLNILARFAGVFDLAYRRFEDLKDAETRNRESQIELALERVRARALAMQQPEELKDVAGVLRDEMGKLGIEALETSSIYINDESTENAECWYAIKDVRDSGKTLVNDYFELNLKDTWVGRQMLRFYQSDDQQVSILMTGKHRIEWIKYCEEKSVPLRGYYGDVIPDRTYHLFKFSHGAVGVATPGDITDENWSLVKRVASVFSLAYSRFKDLTQARIDLQLLKEAKMRAEDALSNLKSTQAQLIHAEKMASLGELTAGIAHEIQNPLNFVNNFSEVSADLIEELKDERQKEKDARDEGLEEEILDDIIKNLEKINHHGQRASSIVKGMLEHSRSGSKEKELTDLNALVDEYLRLAYHGLRAKDKDFNSDFATNLDDSLPKVKVMAQDMGRVVLNLINNAFYAVSSKAKRSGKDNYKSEVFVSTKLNDKKVEIVIQDNGDGIPSKHVDKIFQPFFTTKPTGQGTGLGLSLSYDIITQGHDGHLEVETEEGIGTRFIIEIPLTA